MDEDQVDGRGPTDLCQELPEKRDKLPMQNETYKESSSSSEMKMTCILCIVSKLVNDWYRQ